MASYADLLETCTQSQENFAALHGQFIAVSQDAESQRERNEKLSAQIQQLLKQDEESKRTVRQLQEELQEALAYRERFIAANVTVEQLKGRLETARRGVTDTVIQHEQEVDQLRAQIHDLLSRIDVSSGLEQAEQLKKQVLELEEKCAAVTGQLLEEKQRYSQQLLSAHSALRDQQNRNLELEQKCRAMEGEVTQMRSVVRRSADLQNEAALLKDKAVAEAARATTELQIAKDSLQATKTRLREVELDGSQLMATAQSEFEDEKAKLQARIATLSNELDCHVADMGKTHEAELERKRTHQKQLAAVREELSQELTNMQGSMAEERESVKRWKRRAEQLEEAQRVAKEELHEKENKYQTCVSEKHHLQLRFDALIHQESWTSAELEHTRATLQIAQKRLEEATSVNQANESVTTEVERLRVQLQYRDSDLSEANRHVQAVEARARDIEEAAERRLRVLRQDMKAMKQQTQVDMAKADRIRKKLIRSLMERDAERAHLVRQYATAPPQSILQTNISDARLAEPLCIRTSDAGLDALEMLKAQSQKAAELHHKVSQLTR